MFARPCWLVVLGMAIALIGASFSLQSEFSKQLIREEQQIFVKGVAETWRLVWKEPPKPFCSFEDPLGAITCPCSGFAYGETGGLELIRLVGDREVDRLDLTPLYAEVLKGQDGAMIPRWEFRSSDIETYESPEFESQVRSRPIVQIMNFADYNHDGVATEFFLQTDVAPCGKRIGIIVGITSKNPHLHAFGSARRPNKPLIMQKVLWEALISSARPPSITDWPCGDHGSEIESEVELRATRRGIEGTTREFECTETGGRGRLVRQRKF